MKRELKTRPIYECRCDERLQTKSEESTRLVYTGLLGVILCLVLIDKARVKARPMYDCRCDERLKLKDDESTCLAHTLSGNWQTPPTWVEESLLCAIGRRP